MPSSIPRIFAASSRCNGLDICCTSICDAGNAHSPGRRAATADVPSGGDDRDGEHGAWRAPCRRDGRGACARDAELPIRPGTRGFGLRCLGAGPYLRLGFFRPTWTAPETERCSAAGCYDSRSTFHAVAYHRAVAWKPAGYVAFHVTWIGSRDEYESVGWFCEHYWIA